MCRAIEYSCEESAITLLLTEDQLLESVELGEWKAAAGGKRERTRLSRYAKATVLKDRWLNTSGRLNK